MKQIWIVGIIILSGYSFLNAQKINRIGVYAGPSYSRLYFEYFNTTNNSSSIQKYDALLGKTVGIWVDFKTNSIFQFTTSLGYIEKGGRFDQVFTDVNGTTVFTGKEKSITNYAYLSWSLGMKVIKRGNRLDLYLNIGPRYDYLIRAKYEYALYNPAREDINHSSIGLYYGLGMEYKLNMFWSLDLQTLNNWNFTKLYTIEPWDPRMGYETTVKDKTAWGHLGISYHLIEKRCRNPFPEKRRK